MEMIKKVSLMIVLLGLIVALIGCARPKVKRVGMVIGLKPETLTEYKALHADSNPSVRDLLNKYNIHNFSIFTQQIEGKWYEFGYYEYHGDNFVADKAALAKEPRNIRWNENCSQMQVPLEGYYSWTKMEMVFYND